MAITCLTHFFFFYNTQFHRKHFRACRNNPPCRQPVWFPHPAVRHHDRLDHKISPPGERYRPVSGWAHTMTLIALVSQPRSNLLRLQLPDTSDGTTAVFKTPMYYRCQITSGQLQKNFAKSVTKFMSMTLRHYLPQTIGMKRN